MPRVHLSHTAGARRGMTYVGVSERSFADDSERLQKRARRYKKAMIKEANLIAQSDEWKEAGEQLALLHKRWKRTPSAGRRYDENLWKSFQAATVEFHRRRSAYFAQRDRDAQAKSQTKQQLIAEAQRLSDTADFRQANSQFKDLMLRWRDTGHAGNLEPDLWEQFTAARQAMYDATAQNRRSLQSDYVQRLATRIQRHRETLGKLKSRRRELTIRRQGVTPGWVGEEMIEDFDRQLERVNASIAEHESSLEQDVLKLNQAQARPAAPPRASAS